MWKHSEHLLTVLKYNMKKKDPHVLQIELTDFRCSGDINSTFKKKKRIFTELLTNVFLKADKLMTDISRVMYRFIQKCLAFVPNFLAHPV
jgi:signal-transduction protein with cAMP-binding, CBS, and nucleotidyltransferase domain